mgnify:CR=1 FL=1
MKEQNKLSIILKGLLLENPVFVLVLGTCPTLATTTSIISALSMGLAAAAVLICSNVVISLMGKIIPDKVRIPCYIVIIAGFVTLVQMLMHAYLPELYELLGIYLALITVNCIILGRAEMFANKNNALDSALDGIGMGLGFTLALGLMGAIREIVGAGTIFGVALPWLSAHPILVIALAPGGFFVYACLIAAVNYFTDGKGVKGSFGCKGCAMASICQQEKCIAELEKGVEA